MIIPSVNHITTVISVELGKCISCKWTLTERSGLSELPRLGSQSCAAHD